MPPPSKPASLSWMESLLSVIDVEGGVKLHRNVKSVLHTTSRHASSQIVWLRMPPPQPSTALWLISVPVMLSMPTVARDCGNSLGLILDRGDAAATNWKTPLKMPPPPSIAWFPVITELEM